MGGRDRGAEDFSGLVNYRNEYAPGARRFDVGERSGFQLVPMAMAALEQILDWSAKSVASSLEALTEAIEDRATERGLDPIPRGARAPHMIGVRAPSGLPDGLSHKLAEQRVFVSVRGDSIRVSPHVYNDESDVDRLFAVLDEVLS